jgi:hypothetical protein
MIANAPKLTFMSLTVDAPMLSTDCGNLFFDVFADRGQQGTAQFSAGAAPGATHSFRYNRAASS